jgi:hypothetical protein
MNGFLLLCLTLYTATRNFNPFKLSLCLISPKARSNDSFDVSVGKASRTASGCDFRIVEMTLSRFSGRRARSATARLPWEGSEKTRAIPVP